MSYVVFARKYRPQTFDEVIGQSRITQTLKNAISSGRVAHAYIFAGPRGVGKTTTARILARALNCETGPTHMPCGKCDTCLDMLRSTSLDVLEIDGASNRGIEEIRALRENVKFAPSKGRFRIYIIDEVHMLTEAAFNALLKTLEEPPSHVKFIFATTQGYKVPATILSRCQRFDFRRIASKEIFENLKKITVSEKLDVSDEALGVIAKRSDGSMRDAQVLLDQMTSFVSTQVTGEDVARMLGLVSDDALFEISSGIMNRDPAHVLEAIGRVTDEGKDAIQVTTGLIEHFRNILMTRIGDDPDSLIDAGPDKVRRYRAQSQLFDNDQLLYIIYLLLNTSDLVRRSSMPRIPLEAALVKLTSVPLPIISSGGTARSIEEDVRPNGVISAQVPSDTASSAAPAVERLSDNLEEILGMWNGVIDYIKSRKISIASYLQEGYPVDLKAHKLSIGFSREFQFHKDVLDSADNRKLVEEAMKSVYGRDIKASFSIVEPAKIGQRPQVTGSGSVEDGNAGLPEDLKTESDPIVKAALEMFGGEVAGKSSGRGKAR